MKYVHKSGIIIQKEFNSIRKEMVRKSIHLATGLVPFFLEHMRTLVLYGLASVLVIYCIAETLRIRGKNIFFVSSLTEVAARKRDENRFVLGPVTLAVGVLLSALLFDEKSSGIAIYALAFGDGLASLAGKLYGRHYIPFGGGKTVEGSVTCFIAIFLSTFFVTQNGFIAIVLALLGTLIEVLPIKDFDNIIIPLVLGFTAQVYFHI